MVKKNRDEQERYAPTIDYVVEVKDPKEIEGKENCYRFTLIVNGVTIYGMKDIAYRDRETGEERSFIAFPGYQGRNEKYYNNAWFPISRALQDVIEDQIEALLP